MKLAIGGGILSEGEKTKSVKKKKTARIQKRRGAGNTKKRKDLRNALRNLG